MTIHIFNPDHDLALAANQERFTAPHAGRQLRSDLGFLPALWAENGDVVVVDDIDAAEACLRKLKHIDRRRIEFATMLQLERIVADESQKAILTDNVTDDNAIRISPWGWNKALCFQFLQAGIPSGIMPSAEELDAIRTLSGRQMTTSLLKKLREGIETETCGESVYYETYDEAINAISDLGECVVKAPWSSSGRGVKYILKNEEAHHLQNTRNWMQNVIKQQGGVMIEPLYNKVKDFGMEFMAHEDGSVTYEGLSLFTTVNGAYTGNMLSPEEEKREVLSKHISLEIIDEIATRICKYAETKPYVGPFGVDMMVVTKDRLSEMTSHKSERHGFLLHPCVEINLRRTMGHVALAISPDQKYENKSMSITYNGKNYHFSIKQNIEKIN